MVMVDKSRCTVGISTLSVTAVPEILLYPISGFGAIFRLFMGPGHFKFGTLPLSFLGSKIAFATGI